MVRFSNVLRIAVVGAAVLASIASDKVEGGDRAGGDRNCIDDYDCPPATCPDGETCSDATPNGLFFSGSPTGAMIWNDDWPHVTALGGHQTIHVYLDGDGTQPFGLPYTPTLSGTALSITETDPSSLVVQGDARGTSTLRLAEPDTDLLYDRIDLDAAAINDVALMPAGVWAGHDLDLFFNRFDDPNDSVDTDVRFAVHTGHPVRLTAVLMTPIGRAADDGMTIEGGPEVSRDPQGFFDTVRVTPTAAGMIGLTVKTAAAPPFDVPVEAASRADTIELSPSNRTISTDLHGYVCVRARTASGAYLLGATWHFETDSNLTLEGIFQDVVSACAIVRSKKPVTGIVTATAAGVTHSFRIDVVQGYSKRARRPQVLLPTEAALWGDRAADAAALATVPAQP